MQHQVLTPSEGRMHLHSKPLGVLGYHMDKPTGLESLCLVQQHEQHPLSPDPAVFIELARAACVSSSNSGMGFACRHALASVVAIMDLEQLRIVSMFSVML